MTPTTAPSWPNWLISATLQTLIPATLLLTTPKRSIPRYLAIPYLIWNAARFVQPVAGASPSWCNATALMLVAAIQATNLLLINALDARDLAREKPAATTFPARLAHAYAVLAQNRAVGTPRQVRNVPAHPAYYTRAGVVDVPRARFLRRQGVILLWQLLVLDVFQGLGRVRLAESPSAGFAAVEWRVSAGEVVERVVSNLVTGVVVSRILIDVHYRVMSVVHVGVGVDEAVEWRPAFGRVGDAYTLRRYWGNFWHQFLRQPFTAVSKFVVCDVLGIPRGSLLGRYSVILTVFAMSGLLHVMVDITQAIPWEYSGATAFFSSTALGVVIEEGVQAIWRKMNPRTSVQASPALWARTLGLAWVVTWMGITSTWYFTPIIQVPAETVTLIPFSMVETVGFAPVIGAVVALSLVLVAKFGIEV